MQSQQAKTFSGIVRATPAQARFEDDDVEKEERERREREERNVRVEEDRKRQEREFDERKRREEELKRVREGKKPERSTGVNFTNILRARFSYKSVLRSFSLVTVRL